VTDSTSLTYVEKRIESAARLDDDFSGLLDPAPVTFREMKSLHELHQPLV
jgi:hypothetical protein